MTSAPKSKNSTTAADAGGRLTTQQGIPIADDQNSLTVGERGPA